MATIDLKCFECAEWIRTPESGEETCGCGALTITESNGVRGFYTEFFNPKTEKHLVYRTPRGVKKNGR